MGIAKAPAKHVPQPAKQIGIDNPAVKSAATPHNGDAATQPTAQPASAKKNLASGSSRGHIISIVS